MTNQTKVGSISPIRKHVQATGSASEPLPAMSPSQAAVFNQAITITEGHPFVVVQGDSGVGKTTILRHLHAQLGGRFINCGDALDAIAVRHPHALEEAVRGLFDEALARNDVVFFDDIDMIEMVTMQANAYPRPLLFHAVLKDLFERVRAENKKLFLGVTGGRFYPTVENQSVVLNCPLPKQSDYETVISTRLGKENISALNIDHLYRNNGRLTPWQLNIACNVLVARGEKAPTTEQFASVVAEYVLSTNLNLAEVEKIEFSNLKGAEDIVEKLERTILLPLREPELAKRLGLKPKRGVLLHGHPGTGKTTIGRALAHQMSGKFFMIDGTFVGGSGAFFKKVDRLFQDAIANSPSIIFIDDADVLFKSDNGGFNRYLLTKLDGLASESVGHVCVMMTAMDIADMPVAMVRSGRVEVWLETKLPDGETRAKIVRHYAADLPAEHKQFDDVKLAERTDGFTPADLRRLVGDARGFLGYDQYKGRTVKRFEEYLYLAADEITDVKSKIAAVAPRRSAMAQEAAAAVAAKRGR